MDDDFDLGKAIQIKAFHDVITKSDGYATRALCRWFSKTYHTPLADVEQLPWEYILTHWYEERFSQLEKEQLDHESILLTETKLEKLERLRSEEADARASEMLLKQAEDEYKNKAQKIADVQPKQTLLSSSKIPESDISKLKTEIKPVLTYKVVENDELERLIEDANSKGTKIGK